MKILPAFLLLLLAFQAFSQKTYIHCGRLIDGKSDSPLSERTIVIEGNKITGVLDGYQSGSEADTVIDLKDRTVMSGLMDMHVHLESETNPDAYLQRFTMNPADKAFQSAAFARRTLMAGFTTVRDLGGSDVNTALRDGIRRGDVKGPRVYSAGKSIATTGGHADPTNSYRKDLMGDPGPREGVANGVAECREAVRYRYKTGADLIKITATGGVLSMAKDGTAPQFIDEELQAIVETARDYGMKVAAHAHGAEGIKRAVRAGVASIEHGTFMDEEGMRIMKEMGTWYVPTITAGRSVGDSAKIPGYYPAMVVPKALEVGPQIQGTFAKAYKAGVKIAFGTDAGVFRHGLNYLEFQYMVESGMPAMEAIRSATVHAAELLGESDRLGSVEQGKLADIIAVDGDPLENIKVMKNVVFVMKDGVIYKP